MNSKHSALWLAMAFARVYLIDLLLRLAHPFVWRFGSIDRKIRLLDREIRKLDEIARLSEIAQSDLGALYEEDDRLANAENRAQMIRIREALISQPDRSS